MKTQKNNNLRKIVIAGIAFGVLYTLTKATKRVLIKSVLPMSDWYKL